MNDDRISYVLEKLNQLSQSDMDPHNGHMFGHIYETGDAGLREVAAKAYVSFMWKNMLDPTVYPSIVIMEKELIRGLGKYFHLPEDGSGIFTYGGTESIMLAVLGAREKFKSKHGASETMEIVLPETAHPAFHKASFLLGVKTKVVKVDREKFTVSPEDISESLSPSTGMVVLSAPNYPFGTIDPIRDVAESLKDKDIWFHVDNCIGTNLPFIRLEGYPVPAFDFELDAVTSLSTDMHKYGHSPKNGSILFVRDKALKKYMMFAYSRWAGYPLINTTILSSRSAGSLAAAWAVFNYLGEEGYRKNARRVVTARDTIIRGLKRLGYTIQGDPVGGIFSFTGESINVFALADKMKEMNWYIQAQPGSVSLEYRPSIHMTIAPIHDLIANEFLDALEKATEAVKNTPLPPQTAMKFVMETNLLQAKIEKLGDLLDVIKDKIGLTEKGIGSQILVNELMYIFPPDTVEEVLKEFMELLYS